MVVAKSYFNGKYDLVTTSTLFLGTCIALPTIFFLFLYLEEILHIEFTARTPVFVFSLPSFLDPSNLFFPFLLEIYHKISVHRSYSVLILWRSYLLLILVLLHFLGLYLEAVFPLELQCS